MRELTPVLVVCEKRSNVVILTSQNHHETRVFHRPHPSIIPSQLALFGMSERTTGHLSSAVISFVVPLTNFGNCLLKKEQSEAFY